MSKDIIGHKKQQKFLKKILASGKIPHALLFVGPEKIGKKLVAVDFISQIFRQEPLTHPDFILVEPKTANIHIEQIRNLSSKLTLKPIKAPLIGLVVDDAHSMTTEAQNSFLKALEEPKSKALLILIAKEQSFLLPTILSRCEVIKFNLVNDTDIKDYLMAKKVSKTNVQDILKAAQGRPGLAINMMENKQILLKTKETINEIDSLIRSPLSKRFQYAEQLSKKEDVKDTLFLWLYYFHEKLHKAKTKPEFLKTKNILNNIYETIFSVSATNVNVRLALENLMLEI